MALKGFMKALAFVRPLDTPQGNQLTGFYMKAILPFNGLKTLTSSDFVSSFFRKGKKETLSNCEKKSEFQEALAKLGDTWKLCESIFDNIQEFMIYLIQKWTQCSSSFLQKD